MSEMIIQVESIGKKYLLRHQAKERYTTLRDVITRKVDSIGRGFFNPGRKKKADPNREEFWALKDVSFEVERGEVIGIIGRNGAGKSTLLKLLSRITEPTEGRIRIKGRIASLLEVGTGFHPELTGRENIFLNGAILGMSKAEIKRKFDEIVAFSGMEKFLDTPVKRYSSGMYVRLAFSVAAHLEPEILLVDEVLAVGDIAFQNKCISKMEHVGKNHNQTVLLVSHNMSTLRVLCKLAIYIDRGRIMQYGPAETIINRYLKEVTSNSGQKGEIHWSDAKLAPGGDEMRLISICTMNRDEKVKSIYDPEWPIQIEIVYEMFKSVTGMRIVMQIINEEGIVAFSSTDHLSRPTKTPAGKYKSTTKIPARLLNSGKYFISVHAGCPGVRVLVEGRPFVKFQVERTVHHGSLHAERWPGVVAPELNWVTTSL